MAEVNLPKVTHSTRNKDVNKFANILGAFTDTIAAYVRSPLSVDTIPSTMFSVEGPDLLQLRKQLRDTIKDGMLKRKDKEIEIAILACLVWFNRLERERKLKILEEWG